MVSITKKPLQFIQTHKKVVTTATKAVKTGLAVKKAVTDGFEAAKSVSAKGLKGATTAAREAASKAASSPTGKLGMMGKLKIGGSAVSVVTGLTKLPGQVGAAGKDIRTAMRTGSRQDIATAAKSTISAAQTTVSTTKGALTTAVTAQKLIATNRAATAAFKAAVPGASKAVTSAAGRAAMTSVFSGASASVTKKATVSAVQLAAKETGTVAKAVAGSASRAASKAALREGGKAAAEAAVRAGAKAATGALAKGAARFAPGLNVAIAALDTANAAATLADPKASTGSKITSVITAVGSIAAATNIPIVSQIGAGVSAVSSFVGSFF